jgi:hypothetical protein
VEIGAENLLRISRKFGKSIVLVLAASSLM